MQWSSVFPLLSTSPQPRRSGRGKADEKECLVPTCSNSPATQGLCDKHYDFYINDDPHLKRLLGYLFRRYNSNLSSGERVSLFFCMVLHGITYLSFKGYEHFPLESLFAHFYSKARKLYRQGRLRESLRILSQLMSDFEDPRNHMIYDVEQGINEIKLKLSRAVKFDPKCEEVLKRLSKLSFRPVLWHFFTGALLLAVLYLLSLKTAASGILGPGLFLRIRHPLVFTYGLLVPVCCGIAAAKVLPEIYERLKNGVFYRTKRDNARNSILFLSICSSLRSNEHFGWAHRGILFGGLILAFFHVSQSVSRGDFMTLSYQLLEVFYYVTLFQIFMRLRLFRATISIAVDLQPEGTNIDVRDPDCIGGLEAYARFLLSSFLMGILSWIVLLILPPVILFRNYVPATPLRSLFVFLALIFLVQPFTHSWTRASEILISLHRQMSAEKDATAKRIAGLERKARITVKELRDLLILKDRFEKFRTWPIRPHSTLLTVARIVAGFLIVGYLLPKLIDYVVHIIARVLSA